MKENKNNEVVKYLLENYDIKNANDIAYALKDMFKDTIQTMMNAEFDSFMVYEKNDNKIEKSNYRNGYSSKTVKSQFGEFELTVPAEQHFGWKEINYLIYVIIKVTKETDIINLKYFYYYGLVTLYKFF